ncbi:MAG: flagellar assembly protein FliW [Verrucomicrobiota bacterium]
MSPSETNLETFEKEIQDKTILFPLGIPGFPTHHRFIFVQNEERPPLFWLQSVDDEKLGFAVIEAFRLKKDYYFEVEDTDMISIGSPKEGECMVYFVLCIQDGSDKIKGEANMRAPIIVNLKNKLGRQIIIRNDAQYSEAEAFEI